MPSTIEIFCCYAREDQPLLQSLKAHLMPLQWQGLITIWSDTDINAGAEWEEEIKKHLNTAQIILLLVSPDFMASEYCYSKELKRAMERHEQHEARIIPVLLRPTYWKGVLGKFQALPTDAKAVKSWHDPDEAFFNVAEGIRQMVNTLLAQKWRDEGGNHFKAKRYDEALEAFEQALRLDPNDVIAYREKGCILLKLERYEEGLEALEQALRLDPDSTIAYNRKGIIRLLLESLQEAAFKERYLYEISNYYPRVANDDQYYLLILHRAISQRDQRAWELLVHYFQDMVLEWIRRHPQRKTALQYNTEENYVALTFERFWKSMTRNQKQVLEFSTLASVHNYLRVCLNSAIIDTLRTYARPKEEPLPEPEALHLEEPTVEGPTEIWKVIQSMLRNEREQRAGYLLFYCGLKPREIVRYNPEEFSDVQEIYRLRRSITDRLMRNVDQIRWRISDGGT